MSNIFLKNIPIEQKGCLNRKQCCYFARGGSFELQIKQISKTDIRSLSNSMKKCSSETFRKFPLMAESDLFKYAAVPLITSGIRSSDFYFIIRLNGQVVGFGYADLRRASAKFGFAIIDKFQNKGIGSWTAELLDFIFADLGRSWAKLFGGTRVKNGLMNIYLRRGYKIDEHSTTLHGEPKVLMSGKCQK